MEWQAYFPPASDAQVRGFVMKIGIAISPTYERFLRSTNGGRPLHSARFLLPEINEEVMLGVLFGIGESDSSLDLMAVYKNCKDELPDGYLPIGEDPGGNRILLSLGQRETESIHFWDRVGFLERPTGRKLFMVAENIDEFLASLRPISI